MLVDNNTLKKVYNNEVKLDTGGELEKYDPQGYIWADVKYSVLTAHIELMAELVTQLPECEEKINVIKALMGLVLEMTN